MSQQRGSRWPVQDALANVGPRPEGEVASRASAPPMAIPRMPAARRSSSRAMPRPVPLRSRGYRGARISRPRWTGRRCRAWTGFVGGGAVVGRGGGNGASRPSMRATLWEGVEISARNEESSLRMSAISTWILLPMSCIPNQTPVKPARRMPRREPDSVRIVLSDMPQSLFANSVSGRGEDQAMDPVRCLRRMVTGEARDPSVNQLPTKYDDH